MSPEHSGNAVKVFTPVRDCVLGKLTWNAIGPHITLESGESLSGDTEDYSYEIENEIVVDEAGFSKHVPLKKAARIMLKPIEVTKKPYSTMVDQPSDDLYPPASYRWTSRMKKKGEKASFVIQKLQNDERYWLTIVNVATGEVHESHAIQKYEASIITLTSDIDAINKMYLNISAEESESTVKRALGLLDGPPPTWEDIASLTAQVSIPGLMIGNNMRETVSQLVPLEFPSDVREEIMAFLAWTTRKGLPNVDPVRFFRNTESLRLFSRLSTGHLQCLVDGLPPPPYVRLMKLAVSGRLPPPSRPPTESEEQTSWSIAYHKICEQFPDWTGRVIKYAMDLNAAGRVAVELPVSHATAKQSRRAWGDRLALGTHGLYLSIHIEPQSLGLQHLVYIGAAHRWPHKHLVFSARLGSDVGRSPNLQVMYMPPSAAERVIRARPSVEEIEWSGSSVNLALYNIRKGRWKISLPRILRSIGGIRTIRRLRNEFGGWQGKSPCELSKDEAKALDLASRNVYLDDSESDKYWRFHGITREQFKSTLTKLTKSEILRLQYRPNPVGLASVFILAQGEPDHVCSMVRAFLSQTPTTTARVSRSGESCYLISRVPDDALHELVTVLPSRTQEHGIKARCMPITAYQGYLHNFYTRLLMEDGTWDDDVSAMLSQIRGRP
ncbi:MAG: hypothetical protein RTU09_04095 [Candidatus Thorarchaeota archaeon]